MQVALLPCKVEVGSLDCLYCSGVLLLTAVEDRGCFVALQLGQRSRSWAVRCTVRECRVKHCRVRCCTKTQRMVSHCNVDKPTDARQSGRRAAYTTLSRGDGEEGKKERARVVPPL